MLVMLFNSLPAACVEHILLHSRNEGYVTAKETVLRYYQAHRRLYIDWHPAGLSGGNARKVLAYQIGQEEQSRVSTAKREPLQLIERATPERHLCEHAWHVWMASALRQEEYTAMVDR